MLNVYLNIFKFCIKRKICFVFKKKLNQKKVMWDKLICIVRRFNFNGYFLIIFVLPNWYFLNRVVFLKVLNLYLAYGIPKKL